MANFNLKVMSINIGGLNDRKKRRGVFRWIKQENIDICFIQESYGTQDWERIWKSEWDGNLFFANDGNHARSVLALIQPGLDIKIVNTFTDGLGRVLLLDALMQDEWLSLINIYAPNAEESQVCFCSQLKKIMLQKVPTDNYVLLGGDFNIVMDLRTDARTSTSSNYHRIISTLNYIKDYYQMQDIWRVKHPLASRYTWQRNNPSRVSSWLGYWLSSETFLTM